MSRTDVDRDVHTLTSAEPDSLSIEPAWLFGQEDPHRIQVGTSHLKTEKTEERKSVIEAFLCCVQPGLMVVGLILFLRCEAVLHGVRSPERESP
jgi:hypothetical protein